MQRGIDLMTGHAGIQHAVKELTCILSFCCEFTTLKKKDFRITRFVELETQILN